MTHKIDHRGQTAGDQEAGQQDRDSAFHRIFAVAERLEGRLTQQGCVAHQNKHVVHVTFLPQSWLQRPRSRLPALR